MVWRYVDLARFIHILCTGTLPFVRVDLFRDEFEGSVTRAIQEYERQVLPHDVAEALSEGRRRFRGHMYASCWRFGDDESEAMWRLYLWSC